MRDHDHARTHDAAKTRNAARRPAAPADAPLQRLLALQGSAGNAAVVQMLRRNGQPAGQEQHQHGAGCGHGQNEQPVVQRAGGQDPMAMEIDQLDFSDAEELSDGGTDSEADEWDFPSFSAERDKYPRATTPTPQAAAGFGDSTYGIDPGKVKSMREDRKQGRDVPPLRYRKDNEPLYRWDGRTPDQIMGKGFKPWNEKLPASLRHYQKLLQRTGFVSTTRSPGGYVPDWARQPDGSGWRYVIHAPGGIDLVDTLGTTSFAQQQEVIFWKGIQAGYVVRAELCDAGGNVIKVVKSGGDDAMDID
ncbi:scabin-related ADP-ribosyltransferase [Streptomyces atriruber]|uniref:scabin-related ADP-ribosyltransferase n=1 Tax=Streptomyces atriruber TaxID=545121 RepID=UPI0006E2597E